MQHSEPKLTDDMERQLIQREIDGEASSDNRRAGIFVLELVVGTLLILGSALMMIRI